MIPLREYDLCGFLRDWGSYGDLSDTANFTAFIENHSDLLSITLEKLHASAREARRYLVDAETWYARCEEYDAESVIEALVRLHAGWVDRRAGAKKIWGIKTPAFVRYIPLLARRLPDARFLHIIRHPADVVLSQSKFALRKYNRVFNEKLVDTVWGHARSNNGLLGMVSAATDNCRRALKARADCKAVRDRYLEVHFESILADPARESKRICDFLEVPFSRQMFQFARPSEKIGDARGRREIVRDNAGKYERDIPERILLRMRRACGEEMRRLGYQVAGPAESVGLSPLRRKISHSVDGITIWRSACRVLGPVQGTLLSLRMLLLKLGARARTGQP